MLARTRSGLQRATGQAHSKAHPYRSGDLSIDFAQHRVTVAGEPVRVTNTEYRLLEVLAQNAGQIVENGLLLQRVWGYERGDKVESLQVLIYRLRQKIEPDPAHPRYVLTERGVGYCLSRAE